ncbi:MAG: SPFH domain-containing protein [Myxococcales bacterium]|nr:SPFH domain-containing protein [Myxococcales bacterium]
MDPLIVALIVLAPLAALLAFGSLFTVSQQTTAVIERFGKFVRIARPGLNFKIPLIERVAARVNMRVQQIDMRVETKTHDNVFVHVTVSVQTFVLPDKVVDAFYRLDNAAQQISAFVFDVIRARVPKVNLDDVFANKDDIADAVKAELTQSMDDFGYGIVKALVTDIEPDPSVKAAMNQINAAQRERVAAMERGEANRILQVKAAEAEAQSKALQGKGTADQRRAIVDGLRDSVDSFAKGIPGTTAHDVLALIIASQYFDTLREMSAHGKLTTIMLPHSPSAANDLIDQIRTGMLSAQAAGKHTG